MIPAWVLLVWFGAYAQPYYNSTAITVPFNTEQACRVAEAKLRSPEHVHVLCIYTGVKPE